MGEETTVKNAKLYVLNDGKYEEFSNAIRDIQFTEESCDEPEIWHNPPLSEFSCKVEFRASLMTWIRLLGFSEGIKTWLWTKFRKK